MCHGLKLAVIGCRYTLWLWLYNQTTVIIFTVKVKTEMLWLQLDFFFKKKKKATGLDGCFLQYSRAERDPWRPESCLQGLSVGCCFAISWIAREGTGVRNMTGWKPAKDHNLNLFIRVLKGIFLMIFTFISVRESTLSTPPHSCTGPHLLDGPWSVSRSALRKVSAPQYAF